MTDRERLLAVTLDHIDAGCRATIAARDGKPTDGHGCDQARWCGKSCCIWAHAVLAAGLPVELADGGPPAEWPHRNIAAALAGGYASICAGGLASIRDGGLASIRDGGLASIYAGGYASIRDGGRAFIRDGGHATLWDGRTVVGPCKIGGDA